MASSSRWFLQRAAVFLTSPASDYMQTYTLAMGGCWLAR